MFFGFRYFNPLNGRSPHNQPVKMGWSLSFYLQFTPVPCQHLSGKKVARQILSNLWMQKERNCDFSPQAGFQPWTSRTARRDANHPSMLLLPWTWQTLISNVTFKDGGFLNNVFSWHRSEHFQNFLICVINFCAQILCQSSGINCRTSIIVQKWCAGWSRQSNDLEKNRMFFTDSSFQIL